MKDEKLYDYAKGLNAPYWIQEIKLKKALAFGTLLLPCNCPFYSLYLHLCYHATLWWFYSCTSS